MLCEGQPLATALTAVTDRQSDALLAEYLAAGRFIDFRLAPAELTVHTIPSEAVP